MKKVFLVLCILICSLFGTISAFAGNVNLTDSIGQSTTSNTEDNKTFYIDGSGNELSDYLSEVVASTIPTASTLQSTSVIVKIGANITWWILVILAIGGIISICLDFIAIAIPFSRKLLFNGHSGNGKGRDTGGSSMGMGGGMSRPMGMGGGMSRPMGMGGGMGSSGGKAPGVQLISTEAMNVIESGMGLKDMLKTVVVARVVTLSVGVTVCLLAVCGVLMQLLLLVGNIVANFCGQFIGGF